MTAPLLEFTVSSRGAAPSTVTCSAVSPTAGVMWGRSAGLTWGRRRVSTRVVTPLEVAVRVRSRGRRFGVEERPGTLVRVVTDGLVAWVVAVVLAQAGAWADEAVTGAVRVATADWP